MIKSIKATLALSLLISSTSLWADVSIKQFMNSGKGTASFNCAYKGKVASQKCVVSHSMVKSSIHPMTRQIYGANERLHLLTIKWPDQDVSRYLSVDSGEMINLENNKTYRYKGRASDEWTPDFSRGYIIQSETSAEHVRLW